MTSALRDLLDSAVFITRGIGFSFPFLGTRLRQTKRRSLTVPTVSAIALTRVLLPATGDFQLHSLDSCLTVRRSRPRDTTDSTRTATILLVSLLGGIRRLPALALTDLIGVGLRLPGRATSIFDRRLRGHHRRPRGLDTSLCIDGNLMLRGSHPLTAPVTRSGGTCPTAGGTGRGLFNSRLRFHTARSGVVGDVCGRCTRSTRGPVVVRTKAKINGALNCLLPVICRTCPSQRVIISATAGLRLRRVRRGAVPRLGTVLPFRITDIIMGNGSRCLSLTGFTRSLDVIRSSGLIRLLGTHVLM